MDGNVVVKVPAVQGGAFENANIAVAKANEDNAFLFRHLVGMIEFTTDKPGKVTISGAEGDVLTGTVTVTGFDENGYPQYSEDKVNAIANDAGAEIIITDPLAEDIIDEIERITEIICR